MRDYPSVAGVRFRNAGKLSYFDAAGMRLEAGEYVVVQTSRGPEIGKVVIAPDQVLVNELGDEELPPILRLATDEDIRRMDSLRTKAHELLPEARALAEETGLPARIDTADYTLDGRRLSFTFTSETRIDFRDFVRRASERFGAKVDMRQMGARDRAKLAGGYGVCGRELCCASWLTTFPAISIRMAKDQDLPLNPQKISGLCGRLLCCLSYEEEGYQEMRRSLPKVGQRCSTPTGEGRVIAVNMLRRQVTLVVEGQRVEVGDRDLGLVVRWDTSSKSADPPPSLTRAEAVAMGLLDESELEEPEEEDSLPEAPGRGRLPGPRAARPPRPERPPSEPRQQSRPGSRRPEAPRGRPSPPPAGRAYERQPPPEVPEDGGAGTEGSQRARRHRRRRGRA
jgi:cell fate regulator YaaT (PSP1 superfamily)